MRTVLIVSPRFSPVNTPDMQRVRITLPYFREFGWEPVILAVDPDYVEGVREPILSETFPSDIRIEQVKAVPHEWTRLLGIGSLGLRSLPFLHQSGARILKERRLDLVCFSTTEFLTMSLGRIWKERFGVPFVLDFQDLWVSDYEGEGKRGCGVKHTLARWLHEMLEPWTMKKVDGLIAVSGAYLETLGRRYPWLQERPKNVLPFGGSRTDFGFIRSHPEPNHFFKRNDGKLHGVYVGRGGADMGRALRIIFRAFKRGLEKRPEIFSKLSLHFIGTDYAPDHRAKRTVEPVAKEIGVENRIEEHPQRIPYFESLQLLLDADFLLIPGSDDPQYTASKIFPYILARKPFLGVFHRRSSVINIVGGVRAGKIIGFDPESPMAPYVEKLYEEWERILESGLPEPTTDWKAFERYTARAMTEKLTKVFDQVVSK